MSINPAVCDHVRSSFYKPEIEGLRALAVISVIINHFNKSWLPGGYLGVDIFFILSGYVISLSLMNMQYKNFNEFFLNFYTRRIKRLLPALVFCVTITSFILVLVNPNPEISLKTGISALFGISNFYLLQQATDYFAPSSELNVFTQTWSLGVEEQFYVLFPILLWITVFNKKSNSTQNFTIIISCLVIASYLFFIILNHENPSTAYFLMPARLWELGLGCLLCTYKNNFNITSNISNYIAR